MLAQPVTTPIAGNMAYPLGYTGSTGWMMDALAGGNGNDMSFSRASSGGLFTANGTWSTAGTDMPRYDTAPLTLTPRGLLIEGPRTNLLTNSTTLTGQSVAVTAQAYTLSFYGTGTVTLSGAATGTLVGTGAFPHRVSLTLTPTTGTLTLAVTGSVLNAQLEAGGFASSYIATTTASATRATDNAIVGDLSRIGFNPAEGTLIYEYEMLGNTAAHQELFVFSNAGGTSYMATLFRPANTGVSLVVNGYELVSGVNARVAESIHRVGITYQGSAIALSVDGSTPLTGNAGSSATVDRLVLGAALNGANPGFQAVRRLSYLPVRVGTAPLSELTHF